VARRSIQENPSNLKCVVKRVRFPVSVQTSTSGNTITSQLFSPPSVASGLHSAKFLPPGSNL